MRPHRSLGFTLIEMLVVIGIILVLISIALPNYLDALLRSKVARAKSDIKTYMTALEGYRNDFGRYPRDNWPTTRRNGCTPYSGFIELATPVAYLKNLPVDPFGSKEPYELERPYPDCLKPRATPPCSKICISREEMIYVSHHYKGESGFYHWNKKHVIHAYAAISIGPRGVWNYNRDPGKKCCDGECVCNITPEWNNWPYIHLEEGEELDPLDTIVTYAPTNGIRSAGNIYEMTGRWNQGHFLLDGQVVGRPKDLKS